MTNRRNNLSPGRPRAIIDWDKVDRLLESGCLTTEIAAHFGISTDCLALRCQSDKNMVFSAYKQEKKAKGESLLRAKQFQVAISGDKSMLIWLGKQRLDQRDKPKEEDLEDGVIKKLIKAIGAISEEPRDEEPRGPDMETEQSVLDKEQEGEEGQVQA